MRALVTGIAGFVGSHLAEYLTSRTDCQVWGVVLDAPIAPLPSEKRSEWLRDAALMRLDTEMSNPRASRRVIIVGDD